MFIKSCKELRFPEESIAVLYEALSKINARSDTARLLQSACVSLTGPRETDPLLCMQQIAEQTGIHIYTVSMVVFICALQQLKQRYRSSGLPERLMWDSMMDLTYKLLECKKVHGIWGTAVAAWHTRFYTLQLFKLGRLEYELIPYRWDTPYGNICKSTPVINIHIPSSGSLPAEDVLASLKQAYDFYKGKFAETNIPFVCASWLLYPPMCRTVLPENSNLRRFYELFDILEEKQDPINQDFWRIFDREYTQEVLDLIVPKTTLQRNLLAYLRSGGCMGMGKGAFLFDGHRIIHE